MFHLQLSSATKLQCLMGNSLGPPITSQQPEYKLSGRFVPAHSMMCVIGQYKCK